MIGLDEFVLARLGEDESIARKAEEFPGDYRGHPAGTAPLWTVADATVFGHPVGARGSVEATPGRVFAEVASKRLMLEAAWEDHLRIEGEWGSCRGSRELAAANDYPAVVRLLALPYADHPDFREEWRP